ncbi:MAG: ankyrin repeat domain-containing protein [Armatimonas sp.]
MMRPLLLTALALCASAGAALARQAPPPDSLKDTMLTTDLVLAIRRHDTAGIRSALEHGASPTHPNWLGGTPIEMAALVGNREAIDILREHGATLDKGMYGTGSPLILALLGDSEPIALDFLDHGVSLKTQRPDEASPLMLAAATGKLAVVNRLLKDPATLKQLDIGGETALHYAVRYGQLTATDRLLRAGAAVDAKNRWGQTPLMQAAQTGNTPLVKRLLDAKASPRIADKQGRTALTYAARYSGSATVAALLLKAGADPKAKDRQGQTPSTLARGRGFMDLAKLLPGGTISPTAPKTPHDAVARSLKLIQPTMVSFNQQSQCISCHHQGMGQGVLTAAKLRGFAIDENILKEHQKREGEEGKQMGPLLAGLPKDPTLVRALPAVDIGDFSVGGAYRVLALHTAQVPAMPELAGMTQLIAGFQAPDGSWERGLPRGPMQSTPLTTTAWTLAGISRYMPAEQRAPVLASARRYLVGAKAVTVEEKASKLLGQHFAEASAAERDASLKALLTTQRPDGSFGDSYNTGMALYSLRVGGGLPVSHPAVRRAVAQLLRTQDEDGSWFVNKSARPYNYFFDTGFPGGESQYMSFIATCWATLGLLECDEKKNVAIN